MHVRTFSAPRGAEAVRFSYFPDDARRKFEQWVQTNVPVLTVPRISSVKAMYLPFWSFKATARIKPVIGASITEEVSGPELQIYAGHVYPRAMVEVCKTHPTWARPFEPSMLDIGKGWSVEHVQPYETYESTAWAIVKETALAQLKRQHTLAASITFSAVESRRILMPVYEVTYKWWGEELRCFVNGSTGASYGVQQDIGGPMLAKAMGMLRNLAGPSGGQSLNPQKVGAVIDFLRHLSIDPRAVGPLVTLLGGALRPFLKLLFWPPFLVGSLLAFGGFTLSQAMLPIAKQRKSFAEWEEQRTAEKRMQAGMSDEWKYKATGGSYYEASSSSSSGSSSSSSGGSFYRSSRSTAGSASSAGQGSSSQSQRQQQQQEKAKPKGKKPPYVDENDYYAILGLPRSASVKEIQESFRMELLKYHPDHAEAAGWDMAAASERTRMIIKAYGTLRDPGKRAMYDSTYRFR